MKKIQSYLLGLLTCVVIAGLIALFICRNRIYVWTLGDVPALYANRRIVDVKAGRTLILFHSKTFF